MYVNVPEIWLRDHCHCEKCFHPSTKQRLIETFDEIPADISIAPNGLFEDAGMFRITWNNGHQSSYDKGWLQARFDSTNSSRSVERQGLVELSLWAAKDIKDKPPAIDYDEIMASDDGVKDWTRLVRQYGFCYVDNCPPSPEATQSLLERIAFIRHTHYGGFYDFTADLSKGDTAYTQLGIGAHTDNTYFTEPAGLQLFHMLSHTDGEGGVSQLVDGFAAAQLLREEEPRAYDILSRYCVFSHASGNDTSSIQPIRSKPVLDHDGCGHLLQVRWNTTDRARIDCTVDQLQSWYDAARKWTDILKRIEYWEPLRPGRPLIFDNWRVLHGRSAFTGKRRMCGGYINRDDFISRFKMTNYGREQTISPVA
ncbi:Trimethyllysine dioxygenase [Tothia fuscella]|uniref:Trimethyllysine dioxygenase n=1 Tax=Tothia fuscella TaxID=1048955 RepID=A0A9P4NXA6_9PEZI|nr:Trimethyllysine dioxygenase [Tothia fuscella]